MPGFDYNSLQSGAFSGKQTVETLGQSTELSCETWMDSLTILSNCLTFTP